MSKLEPTPYALYANLYRVLLGGSSVPVHVHIHFEIAKSYRVATDSTLLADYPHEPRERSAVGAYRFCFSF